MQRRKFIKKSGALIAASGTIKSASAQELGESDPYISELELSEKLIDPSQERGVVQARLELRIKEEAYTEISEAEANFRFEDENNERVISLNEIVKDPEIEQNSIIIKKSFFSEAKRIERINHVVASAEARVIDE